MTIAEALGTIDRLRPNPYTAEEKLAWLSELDGSLWAEFLQRRQAGRPGETASFPGYGPGTDPAAELLVPAPYDRSLYTAWLMLKTDEANGEFDRYNQSAVLYNTALSEYRNHVNRQRPAGGPRRWRW